MSERPKAPWGVRTLFYVAGAVALCWIAYAYGVATDDSGFRGDTGGNDLAPIRGFMIAAFALALYVVAVAGWEIFRHYRGRHVGPSIVHERDDPAQ